MHVLLILAAVYGTLVGNSLVQAPKVVKVDGYNTPTWSLTEPQANALGYKLVIDQPPSCASNEYAVAVGYDYDSATSGMRIRRVYETRTVVPPPRKFSKLKIYGVIAQMDAQTNGKTWDAIKAWLEAKEIGGVNGWMAFTLAQELAEDNALFKPLAKEAQALLGLTDEQFEALLSQCVLEG